MRSRSTILIVSTCWWAFPARVAIAFADIGHRVEAICPAHHPISKTKAVSAVYRYGTFWPLRALAKAISLADPALIVPCDDRAVARLHELHAALKGSSPAVAALIERSLGSAKSFSVADRRSELIAVARAESIEAPDMVPVATVDDLQAAIARVGLPAVMKVDGTWGGLGVVVVHTTKEAAQALKALSRPIGAGRALKRLVVDRDPFSLLPFLMGVRPVVNIQGFAAGRPANAAVVCWNGEVLAEINVEALCTRGHRGASTVVRLIQNPPMSEASARLVRRLGLSGFCGFDFLLDDATATVHLIEMNARTTPTSHLSLGDGRNLISALASQLDRVPVPSQTSAISHNVIAFFPQAWLLEPGSKYLHSGFHDVPWEEQALVRELMKLPWPERSWIARALGRFRTFGGRLPPSADPVLHAEASPGANSVSGL